MEHNSIKPKNKSKPSNNNLKSPTSGDVIEYEKQWQIFKGNEYMSNLLTKMKPKISCDCPQSYLYFQKMPKNNMGNYAKEHERLFQNAIHHKKLRSIFNRQLSSAYILPEIFRLENLLKHKSKYKENILANQLYKDNQHMLKRIIQSKSFFSKARAYYGFPSNNHNNNHNNSVSYSNNSHSQTKHSFRKEMNKSSSCLLNNSLLRLMNKTNSNNNDDSFVNTFYNKTNRTKLIDNKMNRTIRHKIVDKVNIDYNKLNDKLIDLDVKSCNVFSGKCYFDKVGLVNMKIKYYFNRVVIVIETFSSCKEYVYLIIVNGMKDLMEVRKRFKKWENVSRGICFENERFAFLKKYNEEFKYYTYVLTKQQYKEVDIEKDCLC